MIVDQSFLDRPSLPPVVIAGSGPAGMTVALRLAERGVASLLLEAGGEGFSATSQERYRGEVRGDPYFDLDLTRLRYLGGSSNHWQGWCRPLDAADFEARPDLGIPGWPIARSDLDPYAAGARAILEINEMPARAVTSDLDEVQFGISPPVQFGIKYADLLRTSPHIHLALGTSVMRLEAADGRVTGLHLIGPDGGERRIGPAITVLACGGIENSRLLLWSNAQADGAAVAPPATLGRYWHEHPHIHAGEAFVGRDIWQLPLAKGRAVYALSEAAQKRFGTLAAAIRFFPAYEGVDRRRDALKRVICAARPVSSALLERAGQSVNCTDEVQIVTEQVPDRENRVALSTTERDGLGMARPVLHWRKSETDFRTAQVMFELFGRFLAETGSGIARAYDHLMDGEEDRSSREVAGHHHMGGTRMSRSPVDGVVDPDLRIHGLSNAYIAGSSVFLRGGHANPTYTIVQLSLRLGDHLARRL